MIQLNSPEIEIYDPSAAIELWHTESIRRRRPEFMEGGKRKDQCFIDELFEDSEEESGLGCSSRRPDVMVGEVAELPDTEPEDD